MAYIYGANSDIGNSRKLQEDYMFCKEYDGNLLAVIADGSGTTDDRLQPAVMAVNNIIDEINDLYQNEYQIFMDNTLLFIRRALLNANKVIGALKISNEEFYSGYSASVTALFIKENGKMCYAHAGNTRLYLIRNAQMTCLTEDHTVAMEKLSKGELSDEQYYVTDDRLKLTSGVGILAEPDIYFQEGGIKPQDILLLTTDGIHYAIRQEPMTRIILESADCDAASANLVEAAKNVIHYPDNMTAIVIRSA